jgi:hypothetical protein
LRRREFLQGTGLALAAAALDSCASAPDWRALRLVSRDVPTAVLDDAAALLERAIGSPVPVVREGDGSGELDVVITADLVERMPGAFRISGRRISGAGEEGARNGLYAFLEELGFGFFRDGETIPELRGAASLDFELEESPAFPLRGDMIWDHYLGPRRYCAAMWEFEEWESALLFLARNRMNFLEFYPPLDWLMARVFPGAEGLEDASVFRADFKHELAKKVLARGRALGIRFMYVLSYGAFPEPVQRLFPELEWRNGFLCAHQPELSEMTERVWGALIEELGTDHWYAVRHRGEEEQVYSDPCRSVTKVQGYRQAFEVLARVDPEATVTVWTWGEKVPDLFETFPGNVRAVHVRHGMANVFGERGEGREQQDGGPELARSRKWLSAQFTVFGGNETLLQTGWCDARALARDAAASSRDVRCEGYFQWPEWSDTSPWLSHAVARISWNPESLLDPEPELARYARARHGERADAFLAGFRPLLLAGNARFMHPPRKRLVAPYFASSESLALLGVVREGARVMTESLEGASSTFRRDFLDLLTWVGVRQAQAFEAAGMYAEAKGTWLALRDALAESPNLSLIESVRALSRSGALSSRIEDSIWTLACDFYDGYPLVLSPEAIELVYLPQLDSDALGEPGWFWHDFPDRPDGRWADSVRKLPREDSARLEREIRSRVRAALSGGEPPPPGTSGAVELLLGAELPPPFAVEESR